MTAIATGELAQAWGKLQAIVPLTAIHNEQQYDQIVCLMIKIIATIRKGHNTAKDHSL